MYLFQCFRFIPPLVKARELKIPGIKDLRSIYRVGHKEHPDKKFEYLPYMSTKGAEIFTSDRGLLKVFFVYCKVSKYT